MQTTDVLYFIITTSNGAGFDAVSDDTWFTADTRDSQRFMHDINYTKR